MPFSLKYSRGLVEMNSKAHWIPVFVRKRNLRESEEIAGIFQRFVCRVRNNLSKLLHVHGRSASDRNYSIHFNGRIKSGGFGEVFLAVSAEKRLCKFDK